MKFTATHVTILTVAGLATFAGLALTGHISKDIVDDAAKAVVALAAWFVGWIMKRPQFVEGESK